MIVQQEPWPHVVIANYYDQELFDAMKDELVAWVPLLKDKPEWRKYLAKKKCTIRDIHTDPILSKELPATNVCVMSRTLSEEQLSLFPRHREHKKPLTLSTEVNVILDDHDYPVHSENPRKILTMVTYIMPDEGRGTCIYDKDKNYVCDIPWKPNNTLIFAGHSGETWHGYNCIPGTFRITVNSFLWDRSINYEGEEHSEGFVDDRIKNLEIKPIPYPFEINK